MNRNPSSHRKRFGLPALIAAGLLVSGISGAPADDKVTEVNIGSYSKAVDYAPYLVARSKGWFDEAFAKDGIKVNHTEFQETPAPPMLSTSPTTNAASVSMRPWP